jgi:Demerecviridae HNH endonuclease
MSDDLVVLDLSFARLRELLDYNPQTGWLTWRVEHRTGRGKGRLLRASGSRAGCWHDPETTGRKLGWRSINIDHHLYREARVIWFWMTGKWPDRLIDHANGDSSDNRWSNLRLATDSQNKANSEVRSDSLSGVKGVHRLGNGRYRARLGRQHLGYFDTADAAHAAFVAAAQRAYGDFAHG